MLILPILIVDVVNFNIYTIGRKYIRRSKVRGLEGYISKRIVGSTKKRVWRRKWQVGKSSRV